MATENTEIALERIMLKVAAGDTAALASLLEDATTTQLIDQVSRWAEKKYEQDSAEVRQALVLKILTRIHTLRNARSFRGWLQQAARNYCLDEIRHRDLERNARESRSLIPLQPFTPEQLLNEREVLLRLRRATRSFPPEVMEIVDRLARGESEREIAEGTGESVQTIHRILKSYRKAIIEHVTREQNEPSFEKMHIEPTVPLVLDRKPRSRQTSKFSTEQILSAMEQLDAAELEKLVPRAIALGAARRAPHLKRKESKLLARANEALPAELKSRLSKLQQKRDASSLTDAEFEELTSLSDRVEELHAERLEALADLAKLRGLTLTALMDKLGIRFPDNA